MSLTATVRALVLTGATPEMILAVVEAHEACASDALAARRASDAERQREKRERDRHVTSRDVTVTVDEAVTTPAPPSSLPPRPPIPTTPTPPDITTRASASDFDRFWAAYPRKEAKATARKAFARAVVKIGGPDPPAILLGALERAKASWVDAQFIPHPATWLNGERWDDEPEIPRQALKAHDGSSQRPPDSKQASNLARAFAGSERAAEYVAQRR